MKIRITLKDPDGIYECIRDAVRDTRPAALTNEEWDEIEERRVRDLTHGRWIDCGDYIIVEIDTETDTAAVVPVKG